MTGTAPTADARVAAIRKARAKQGHALTLLQEAIIRTMAAHDPPADVLAGINAALDTDGQWQSRRSGASAPGSRAGSSAAR